MLSIGHCSVSLFFLAMVTAFTSGRDVWYCWSTAVILGCVWSRELLGFLRPKEVELYINYAAV